MNLRTLSTSAADIVAAMAFTATSGRTRVGLVLPVGSYNAVQEAMNNSRIVTTLESTRSIKQPEQTIVAEAKVKDNKTRDAVEVAAVAIEKPVDSVVEDGTNDEEIVSPPAAEIDVQKEPQDAPEDAVDEKMKEIESDMDHLPHHEDPTEIDTSESTEVSNESIDKDVDVVDVDVDTTSIKLTEISNELLENEVDGVEGEVCISELTDIAKELCNNDIDEVEGDDSDSREIENEEDTKDLDDAEVDDTPESKETTNASDEPNVDEAVKDEPEVIDTTDASDDEYFRSSVSRDIFLIKLSLIGAFNEIVYDNSVETVCDHKAYVTTIVKRYDTGLLKTIDKPAIMIEDALKAAVCEREHARTASIRAKKMAEIEERRKSLRLNLSETFYRGEDPEMRDAPPQRREALESRSGATDNIDNDEVDEVFDRFVPPSRRHTVAGVATPSKLTHMKSWSEERISSPRFPPSTRTKRRPFVTPTETMASIRASVEKKYSTMPRSTASFDERSLTPSVPSYTVEERPGMPAIIHLEDLETANFAISE